MTVIDRPDVDFDAPAHVYAMEGSDDLPGGTLGVSTVAKVGGVEDTWGIASAWGFRIGYEGAFDVATEAGALAPFDVEVDTRRGPDVVTVDSRDTMREALKGRGLTPWATRDRAATRGTNVHAVLEALSEDTARVPTHDEIEAMPEEERGHVRSIIRWYLAMRPRFVAMEVQVASRTHVFAGRYDLRVLIDARRVLACIDPVRTDPQAARVRAIAAAADAAGLPLDHLDACALVLVDLKTSKGVYPTTHFPQLEGYEGAGVEMGFPATDCRAVLNTNADGSFTLCASKTNDYGDEVLGDFAVSWSTYDDFLAFAAATRAIRRMKAADPAVIRERVQTEAIVACLPAASRDVVALGVPELAGLDAKAVGRILGKLRKREQVEQVGRGVWQVAEGE